MRDRPFEFPCFAARERWRGSGGGPTNWATWGRKVAAEKCSWFNSHPVRVTNRGVGGVGMGMGDGALGDTASPFAMRNTSRMVLWLALMELSIFCNSYIAGSGPALLGDVFHPSSGNCFHPCECSLEGLLQSGETFGRPRRLFPVKKNVSHLRFI